LPRPNSNTNRTLTIPDATTTIVGTDATQTLTNKSIVATQLTGTIAAARLPAGSVIQVVNATYGTQVSTTSGAAWTDVFSASITPTSSSSKILVLCSANGCHKSAADTNLGLRVICGTSTIVIKIDGLIPYTGSAVFASATASTSYLDSPATTSAITYKLQFINMLATGTVYVNTYSGNAGDSVSTLTLMEIAA